MRLALRVIINFMNLAESQLDQVDNELRAHPKHRTKFQEAKRQLRQAIRAFVELNDEMGDAGIN
jgi:hypothetical protein